MYRRPVRLLHSWLPPPARTASVRRRKPQVRAAIAHADNMYIDYMHLNAPVHTWPVD
ncbi:hypothetical protein [Streptomyces griseoluteus]|uniref:hypothetical protein n=1 Tax=Streptomyces griseoluteus TaxID=29306 RepID=UPI00367D89A0